MNLSIPGSSVETSDDSFPATFEDLKQELVSTQKELESPTGETHSVNHFRMAALKQRQIFLEIAKELVVEGGFSYEEIRSLDMSNFDALYASMGSITALRRGLSSRYLQDLTPARQLLQGNIARIFAGPKDSDPGPEDWTE